MGLMKIFKLTKKGSKKIRRSSGAAVAGGEKWPPGIRIGVFGNENTGKTVYFTVLYHQSKIAKDLQISITDKLTSVELLANYMSIWGLGSGTAMGTIVDQMGEKKFPEPTSKTTVLQFTAILDGKKKIPVVTCDYSGNLVSIAEQSDEAEKIKDFMAGADGILFFFDPKILGADLEAQKRASSFINMLESVAPLRARLAIPVALVVTKADTLPGFSGEERTTLIGPEDEQFVSENFVDFVEKVLNSKNVAADMTWAATVRKILERLREFLKVVVGRTLDFQVFFVSNTGNEPIKIGADVGRSLYKPPEKINPCGVKEPFYWILHAAARNRSINRMRKIAKFAAAACIIWLGLYSLPYILHFGAMLGRAVKIETTILESLDHNHLLVSENQAREIGTAYRRYGDKYLVRTMFPEFRVAATHLQGLYRNIDLGSALERVDGIINEMRNIVLDPKLHPAYNAARDSLVLTERQSEIVRELGRMRATDQTSVLAKRSGRTLDYWELFTRYVKNPGDSTVLDNIGMQVANNEENAENYSAAEQALGQALLGRISTPGAKPRSPARGARTSLEEYDRLRKKVNDSSDPEYILVKAPDEVAALRNKLVPAAHAEQIAALNRFIERADRYKKRQKFVLLLQSVPGFDHLHIEVTEAGKAPAWKTQTQLLQGEKVSINWKMGDEIHIAYDETKFDCKWGDPSSDRIILRGRVSLFQLEGQVTFPNINKTVTIGFEGGLKEKLPKLE